MNKYAPDLSSQFKDKVIVVTGSTQGSGAETAKLFAARGAKAITICGRQEDKGQNVKKEIESSTNPEQKRKELPKDYQRNFLNTK